MTIFLPTHSVATVKDIKNYLKAFVRCTGCIHKVICLNSEPGAETPGPDPIHSAFAPITGPREPPFMPVVVPQPQLSSSENQV